MPSDKTHSPTTPVKHVTDGRRRALIACLAPLRQRQSVDCVKWNKQNGDEWRRPGQAGQIIVSRPGAFIDSTDHCFMSGDSIFKDSMLIIPKTKL